MLNAIGEDTEREALAEIPIRAAELYSAPFSVSEQRLPLFSYASSIGHLPGDHLVSPGQTFGALDNPMRRAPIRERLTRRLADGMTNTLEQAGGKVILVAERMSKFPCGSKTPSNRMTRWAHRSESESKTDLDRRPWSIMESN